MWQSGEIDVHPLVMRHASDKRVPHKLSANYVTDARNIFPGFSTTTDMTALAHSVERIR